jgi:hypothetical protein
MARLITLLAATAYAAAVVSAAGCSATLPAPTSTWVASCKNLTQWQDTQCWTGPVPDATSTVLFPAGTNATLSTWFNSTFIWPYTIFTAANIIIDAGAAVTLETDGMQVLNCLRVDGTLTLNATNSNPFQTPTQAPVEGSTYEKDPAQPEGTDCAAVPVGFTPRVCGPGALLVQGEIHAVGLYASFFLSGSVAAGGVAHFDDQSFYWGNLTNNGVFRSTGYVYQHGFLTNNADASVETLAFDKWAKSFEALAIPLLITNHGVLNLTGDLYPTNAYYREGQEVTTGTYRTVLFNYNWANFVGPYAASGFDGLNAGTMRFLNDGQWYGTWYNFEGDGEWTNRGKIIVDGATVYFQTFQSVGGTIETINGGNINFGQAVAAQSAMRTCSLVANMPSELMHKFKQNTQQRSMAARSLGAAEGRVVDRVGDGCFWYLDFCYGTPYEGSPPVETLERSGVADAPLPLVDPSGVSIRRHGGVVRLRIQEMIAEGDILTESPCDAGRVRLVDTTVQGDGSGSIASTVPVEVVGTLTLKTGGKWFIATERGLAPVYGGGKVLVKSGAAVYGGIEANFRYYGSLEVERGGLLAIPRHAAVRFTNHTVLLRAGAKLHVDGALAFQKAPNAHLEVDHCAFIDGVGDVAVDIAGRMSCAAEQHQHDQVFNQFRHKLRR